MDEAIEEEERLAAGDEAALEAAPPRDSIDSCDSALLPAGEHTVVEGL